MNRLICILLGALGLLMLSASGLLHKRLLFMRQEERLNLAAPLENAPPLVAFTTVALGGFRGVLADFLWLRASALEEEGRYFELVQLADWITKLEPRCSTIWAFQAWNMAYNISALFTDPEDRWRWVRHGISLLRDSGLHYNPGDAQLYRELAWLFQHKLGGDMDSAHLYYKLSWAREMEYLFGRPHPDFSLLAPETITEMADRYRLKPGPALQVDRLFGPFDWRLPQAHAIYWAWQGKACADDFETRLLDRMIRQCTADAFRQGRLFINTNENAVALLPNFDLLPRVADIYHQNMRDYHDDVRVMAAQRRLFADLVFTLYTFNRVAEAQRVMKQERQNLPVELAGADLEHLVLSVYRQKMAEQNVTDPNTMVANAAYQGCYWHAMGEPERAQGYTRLARLCRADFIQAGVRLKPPEAVQQQVLARVRREIRHPESAARLDTPVNIGNGQ